MKCVKGKVETGETPDKGRSCSHHHGSIFSISSWGVFSISRDLTSRAKNILDHRLSFLPCDTDWNEENLKNVSYD